MGTNTEKDATELMAGLTPTEDEVSLEEINKVPPVGTKEWTEYLLVELNPDEMWNGLPKVNGLRRLVSQQLGEITESSSRVIQCPNFTNKPSFKIDEQTIHIMSPAVVSHTIVIDNGRLTFTAVADAYVDNMDPKFLIYSTAVAATRAEAIALKKALKLTCVSADEIMKGAWKEEEEEDKPVTAQQLATISMFCDRLSIDKNKYFKYHNKEKLSFEEAKILISELNNYQKDESSIPTELKGD